MASSLADDPRHAARRLLRGDAPRARARRTARRPRRRASLYSVEGVPERRRSARCSPRRGSAPRCRRSASSRTRSAAGIPAARDRPRRQQQVRRGAARRPPRPGVPRRARRARRRRARAAAGVRRVLVRVTPGIDADTHWAIQTGHRGLEVRRSRPSRRCDAIARGRELGLDVAGPARPHRLAAPRPRRASAMTIDWLAAFAADCRTELGWTPCDRRPRRRPRHPLRRTDEPAPPTPRVRRARCVERLAHAWALHDLPAAAADLRAGPLARRPGGRHALPRRRGQAGERERHVRRRRRRHVGQPAPAALRRAALGAAREPRRRAAGGHVRRSAASTASRRTC